MSDRVNAFGPSSMKREVHVVGAVRTAIGTFGGSLRDTPPGELAIVAAREAMRRAGVDPQQVDHTVFGQVVQTEPRDAYLARVAAVEAAVPHRSPALTVNRLCGSGLQAVLTAAQTIMLGDAEIALAGGAESMSRAPFLLNQARWGARLGDSQATDMLLGVLNDPFGRFHMGITAENVAEKCAISRQDQDNLALESHRRAALAQKTGHFRDQIVPVTVRKNGKDVTFDADEHIRLEAKLADFEKLRPVFKQGGTVTAGNASGINDGAAAIVLASAEAVNAHGLRPMVRLVSYGVTGVDPALMGLGPIDATRMALQRAGLAAADLDLIESNEAFAAQACAVSRALDLDPAKVNPNGSGISLGHPVGATGVINTVKAVYELTRTKGRYGLVTMCIGGGQGIAAVFERV